MTPEQKAIGKENFQRVVGKLADEHPRPAAGRHAPALHAGADRRRRRRAAHRCRLLRLHQQRLRRPDPSRPASSAPATKGASSSASTIPPMSSSSPTATSAPATRSASLRVSRRRRARVSTSTTAAAPADNIRLYEDYKQLLDNPEIEMVVIALPLHLHAQVAIEALQAGKHVLCEKLMAWNISQCKEMIHAADEPTSCSRSATSGITACSTPTPSK